MLKSKFLKITTAMACIATLILPHTSVVFAAALTNENPNDVNKVKLISSEYHEGGQESSQSLSEEGKNNYDKNQYEYWFGAEGATPILKIVREDDKNSDGAYEFSDAFYCLDGNNSFPSIEGSIEYTRTIPDFFDENPSTLGLDDSNYNALCWLLDNMYLRKQMTVEQRAEQKNAIIENAYSELLNSEYEDATTIDDIKARITDDDIEVVQQWAIWYFTNYGEETLQHVPFTNDEKTLPNIDLTNIMQQTDSMEQTRYNWLTTLYQYFVNTALEHKNEEYLASSSKYPSIENKNATCELEENHYKIGPFKITKPSSNLSNNDYQITLTDGTKPIPTDSYTIKDKQGNVLTDVNTIFDTEYYIYLPVSENTISEVKLKVAYTKSGTKASVWQAEDRTYQPLVLITKGGEPVEDEIVIPIKEINYDLALRKYIVGVNDKEITDRIPDIDVTGLQNKTSTTAEYKHKKTPVEVQVGDIITYEIVVYNEGNIEASATEIVDYLPEGLEFIEDNQTNKDFGWTANGNIVTTNKTSNIAIAPFKDRLTGVSVRIVCRVTEAAKSGSILTNIAEIKSDNIKDRDSTPNSLEDKINSIDRQTHNQQFEDDDDFEKLVVAGKAFDLSLQKFITKINRKELSQSRQPVVNTAPLKNGSTNAEYATSKTPILVQKGDIVTYTIRVYNEGEVDGYAESIADYLPEGLGYLVNYNTNINNYWALPTDTNVNTIKLSTITNANKNLKVEDFTGITDLNNVDVVTGKVKLTSTALNSSNSNHLIKAFDGSDKLSYKDVEITCVVLSDSNLKNIAEITKNVDANKNEVVDRDSTPDTVNPDNYPGDDQNQDDHDYELLTMKKFDLALQKFITGLNDKEITNRIPKITYQDNKITYEHPDTPLEVNNGDEITYTIRVYNEGEIDGYAAEIGDNIPNGLIFETDNEINKKYGWKMYDANGKETADVKKAVEIRTDYLSKEKSEERKESALLKAFDTQNGNLFYLDVKVVFKVDTKSSDSVIVNIAEITKNTDSDGNDIEDIDSTPNNKKEGEDDLDKEKVHVGYFDLALQKDLIKAIVTEGSSTKEIPTVNGELMKVEIHRKKVNSTIVKFVYHITIKNEGTIAGYAKEIKDYIPQGLQFVESDNKGWKANSENVITTEALANTLLQPGETATVEVVLRWINGESNLGLKTNVAEISKDYNDANDTDDIDSTPDNKKEGEDDIDEAPVILSISTGRAPMYIILSTTVLTIISAGVIMIKKYVL